VSVKGTLVEDKMRRFKGECPHFSFSKCPIYNHDSASAQFSTNSHETDNSVSFDILNILGTVHMYENVPPQYTIRTDISETGNFAADTGVLE
jgi:hypothetical protein